jgi:hypothetical protein
MYVGYDDTWRFSRVYLLVKCDTFELSLYDSVTIH